MKFVALASLAAGLSLAGAVHATNFVVDAMANSSSGGVGVSTFAFATGDHFVVNVDPADLWSAGPLPRWSNADGLTHDLHATGTDDSGQPAGTLIGANFGLWTQANLSAPFGTLVGEINGNFEVLGTHFDGVAWQTGTLSLFYWDANNADNSQFITASVTPGGVTRGGVPEPATWGLMLVGFGGMGAILRGSRRKGVTA
jgi:hypothetical protein